MKNLFLSSLLILSTFLLVNAQDFEGEITYDIEYTKLPEEIENFKAMLPKKSVVLMKNERSVSEQKSMGIVNIKIITNTKTKKTATLMNMMGKKIYMEDELDKEDIKNNLEVIKKKETKVIAGYKCNKAIVKTEEGQEMVFWYTKDLPGYKGKGLANIDIEGFPMEFELNQEEMSMKMSVKSVKKKTVNDSVFEIPSDYQKKTKEEMGKMMGGMGGM